MSDENPLIESQVQMDFNRARLWANLKATIARLSGLPSQLLSFEEVREKLHIGGPIYRGVQQVPVEKILGSVDRYRDFDRAFLPLSHRFGERWRSVNRAFYQDVSLPPVLLYQVDQVYFVVDGHHRVSVAREHGQLYIDAEVRECQVSVPVSADIKPEDLVVLGQQAEFYRRTDIQRLRPDHNIEVTVLGGYDRMLEHIAVHRYFLGLDWAREISSEEAVTHWFDEVYTQIVATLSQNDILSAFPGRTFGDLYLWVLDHQHFLVEQTESQLSPPQQAAEAFVELVQKEVVAPRKKPKPKSE